MAKNKQQPIPKKGYAFTSWAVFNWGLCHQRCFRTRKEAIEWCLKNMRGVATEHHTWKQMKKYMCIKKVVCKVI